MGEVFPAAAQNSVPGRRTKAARLQLFRLPVRKRVSNTDIVGPPYRTRPGANHRAPLLRLWSRFWKYGNPSAVGSRDAPLAEGVLPHTNCNKGMPLTLLLSAPF